MLSHQGTESYSRTQCSWMKESRRMALLQLSVDATLDTLLTHWLLSRSTHRLDQPEEVEVRRRQAVCILGHGC